jgi:hypothetical protein
MECSNKTQESVIYWNKKAVNPPNQSQYRYNGMMNYLERLEELQRRSTHMLYESNRSQWNKIQNIIFESNRSQLNEIKGIISKYNGSQLNDIQGIVNLLTDLQKIMNIDQEDHNRIYLKLEELQHSIKKQFEDQEEEFLAPLLKKVNKIKKRVKGLKKYVKSAYDELEDIADLQDEQLELLEENRDQLGQIAVVQGEQALAINAQLEEIVRLQGELMLLLETVNSSIVQLLSRLPAGNKVSSITIRGNEISLDAFISYDTETNTATFRQIDGSLVVVDVREIVAITFPSSSN